MSILSICHSGDVLLTLPSDVKLMFLVCQCSWVVDFSVCLFFWWLYFSINAVLKTYLLDLYSYRKYFILISLKQQQQKILVLDILFWSRCAGLFLFLVWMKCLNLFYLNLPEGKSSRHLVVPFFSSKTQRDSYRVSPLHSNPAPYVLMPWWLICACGTERSHCFLECLSYILTSE